MQNSCILFACLLQFQGFRPAILEVCMRLGPRREFTFSSVICFSESRYSLSTWRISLITTGILLVMPITSSENPSCAKQIVSRFCSPPSHCSRPLGDWRLRRPGYHSCPCCKILLLVSQMAINCLHRCDHQATKTKMAKQKDYCIGQLEIID